MRHYSLWRRDNPDAPEQNWEFVASTEAVNILDAEDRFEPHMIKYLCSYFITRIGG